jgi:hypothetical protein
MRSMSVALSAECPAEHPCASTNMLAHAVTLGDVLTVVGVGLGIVAVLAIAIAVLWFIAQGFDH